MACIGIVDDEKHIRRIVEAYLQKEGYKTFSMETGEEAVEYLKSSPPDLWVIDIMLPGIDGYEVCKRIREVSEVPVIMISARDEAIDKILGLELGSDDYLTKPFNPRELVARVKRHLFKWQQYQNRTTQLEGEVTNVGPLTIDSAGREILWHGESILATKKEFLLVRFLVERQGAALSRDEILFHVWGGDYFGSDRAVDDLIKRIRHKMQGFPVETVWGYGYRIKMTELR